MRTPAPFPDLRPGDTIVTLSDLRAGDLVRLERVDAGTVGLRVVAPGAPPPPSGLFRIERGDGPESFHLVQVRAPGPLN